MRDDVVPPGFESLAEPRTVYVDLYFAERRVLTTPVTTDGQTLAFDEPDTIAATLEQVRDAPAVATLLSNDLPTNAARVCRARADPPGCGQVDADPVAVIFDEASLRLDLFLDADLQVVQDLELQRHLPDPIRRPGMVASLSAAGRSGDDREAELDVIGNLTGGIGSTHVFTQFDYEATSAERRLTDVRLTHLRRDLEWSGGTLDVDLGAALPRLEFFGTSIESGMRTRVDLDAAFGSPLVVYLPRSATVQLVVDDRVRSVQRYPAGNQTLDTRSLPTGTYEVEIRIDDPVTGLRVERELYTHSSKMPPYGESIFGIAAGRLLVDNDTALPRPTERWLYSLSRATRIARDASLQFGIAGFDDHVIGHGEFLRFGRRGTVQASLGLGTGRTFSGFMRMATKIRTLNLSIDGRMFRSSVSANDDPILERVFSDNRDQLGLSVSTHFGRHSLNARTSLQRRRDPAGAWRERRQFTFGWRWPFLTTALWRGYLQADIGVQDGEATGGLRLHIGARPRDETDLSVSLRARHASDGPSEQALDLSATRRFDDLGGWRTRWMNRIGLETTRQTFESDIDMESAHVGAALSGKWTEEEGRGSSHSFVGTGRAAIGLDADGTASSGGHRASAGVLLSTFGASETGELDVLVNGSRVATVMAGSDAFVGLSPYREYRIDVLPRSLLVVRHERLGETFTLLPGNVVRIAPEVYREILAVGVLVDSTGEILTDVEIEREGLRYPVDSVGVFQVPARPGERLSVRRGADEICRLAVPPVVSADYVFAPEDAFVCRGSSAPAAGSVSP